MSTGQGQGAYGGPPADEEPAAAIETELRTREGDSHSTVDSDTGTGRDEGADTVQPLTSSEDGHGKPDADPAPES